MAAPTMNPYLRTKILTASPQELRLMLYEGAIRFSRQGQDALRKKDFEGSYNALSKAKKIVLELSTSLNSKIAPDLCSRLAALYTYIYRQLVEAGLQRNAELIDEPIQLLEYEHETWRMMMTNGHETPASDAAPSNTEQAPAQIAGATPARIAQLSAGQTDVRPRLSASA